MTSSEQLEMLKKNLQQKSAANDDLLIHLLEQAGRRFTVMGITDDGSAEYADAKIDMAAYLFRARNRAGSGWGSRDESDMPRFLRKEINDLKLHQQAERGGA